MSERVEFLPGVPAEHVLARLEAAGGNEVGSGKLNSPESSSALAVNCFGWFVERPHALPNLPGLNLGGPPKMVDVEFCARFPFRGGRHPWLDAVVQSESTLVGVESKRFEPFRGSKAVEFSDAYSRPVWGEGMKGYERLRDYLPLGRIKFTYLDATQLVKHALGLYTEAGRQERNPVLVYLFAEPSMRSGHPITPKALADHRSEIALFASAVAGDDVAFFAYSYRDWLETWRGLDQEVIAHGERLLATFAP